MDLNISARRAYAASIAKHAGLRLKEEEINFPRTDGNTIYVPFYDADWDWNSDEAVYWWYAFSHEIAHNKFKEDFKIIKREKIDNRSPFGFVHNLNIDHNIEVKSVGEYEGIDSILKKGRANFLKAQIEKHSNITKKDPKMDAVWTFDTVCRQSWNTMIEDELVMDLDEEAQGWYDKLLPFAELWSSPKDSETAYELTCKVCEVLEIEKTEQQEEEAEGEGSGSSSEEGGDEEQESGSATPVVDYMDMLNHEHGEDGTEETEHGAGIKIDYSNWDHFSGYQTGNFKFEVPVGTVRQDVVNAINDINSGSTLASEIRKYLIVLSRSHMETGYKKGRLDTSRLWKPKVYGSHSQAGQRVFMQNQQKFKLDSAVTILVDQSGSMYGNKYYHAVKAAALLSDVLTGLRIPIEIQSFSDNRRENVNWIHKKFTDKVQPEALIESFATSANMMNSNADGESIINACSNLLARKEQRKIMVVLSDGMPSTFVSPGDIYGYTKKVVNEIETNSPIDIYGVGIMDKSVENIYRHNKVIWSADEIESTLLHLLKEQVLV